LVLKLLIWQKLIYLAENVAYK